MRQATIKYEDEKILEAIVALGREIGFTVSDIREEQDHINGVPYIKGDPTVEIEFLNGVFTDIDARELRRSAWRRGK